jgi:uncharacterized protein YukE
MRHLGRLNPVIGGDSGVFRAAAARVRGWSDTLHTDAARLRSNDDVHWVGTAGDAFRERLVSCADKTLASCAEYDAYAESLEHLAQALDSRQEQLASLVAVAGATWDEVRDAVTHGAGDALDVARGMADAAAEKAGDVVDGAKELGEDVWRGATPW